MPVDDPALADDVQALAQAIRIAFAQCAGQPFSFFEQAKNETVTAFHLSAGLRARNIWVELNWLATAYEVRAEEGAPLGVAALSETKPSEILRLTLTALNGEIEVASDLYARPTGTIEHWNEIYLHPNPSLNLAGGRIASLIEPIGATGEGNP